MNVPQATTTTRYGHRMAVDPTDLIGQRILAKGIFDGPTVALMLQIFKAVGARTVLDIGANIGNHTLAFSRCCRQVVAFEPGIRNYGLLARNAELNPDAPVRTVNIGLSSQAGTATLFADPRNFGGASLAPAADARTLREETITLAVGDAWLAEQAIRDIDVIKLDVEGHEAEVLEGLAVTLAEWRPLVFLEWNSAAVKSRFRESHLVERLCPDYQMVAIEHSLNKQYWGAQPLGRLRRRLRCWLGRKRAFIAPFDQTSTYGNVMLVPNEKRDVLQGLPARPPFF